MDPDTGVSTDRQIDAIGLSVYKKTLTNMYTSRNVAFEGVSFSQDYLLIELKDSNLGIQQIRQQQDIIPIKHDIQNSSFSKKLKIKIYKVLFSDRLE